MTSPGIRITQEMILPSTLMWLRVPVCSIYIGRKVTSDIIQSAACLEFDNSLLNILSVITTDRISRRKHRKLPTKSITVSPRSCNRAFPWPFFSCTRVPAFATIWSGTTLVDLRSWEPALNKLSISARIRYHISILYVWESLVEEDNCCCWCCLYTCLKKKKNCNS